MRPNQYPPGSHVAYTAPHEDAITEYGVVTSTNTHWVFVLYSGHTNSEATHPDNLQIIDAADELGLYQT